MSTYKDNITALVKRTLEAVAKHPVRVEVKGNKIIPTPHTQDMAPAIGDGGMVSRSLKALVSFASDFNDSQLFLASYQQGGLADGPEREPLPANERDEIIDEWLAICGPGAGHSLLVSRCLSVLEDCLERASR